MWARHTEHQTLSRPDALEITAPRSQRARCGRGVNTSVVRRAGAIEDAVDHADGDVVQFGHRVRPGVGEVGIRGITGTVGKESRTETSIAAKGDDTDFTGRFAWFDSFALSSDLLQCCILPSQ